MNIPAVSKPLVAITLLYKGRCKIINKIIKRVLIAVFVLGLYKVAASLYISDRSGISAAIIKALVYLHIIVRSSKVYAIVFSNIMGALQNQ